MPIVCVVYEHEKQSRAEAVGSGRAEVKRVCSKQNKQKIVQKSARTSCAVWVLWPYFFALVFFPCFTIVLFLHACDIQC